MNEKPFDHHCSNGSSFQCSRCDFTEPIEVLDMPGDSLALFAADVAEMIGFHAINIWPKLNGFQGYDTIDFDIVCENEDE